MAIVCKGNNQFVVRNRRRRVRDFTHQLCNATTIFVFSPERNCGRDLFHLAHRTPVLPFDHTAKTAARNKRKTVLEFHPDLRLNTWSKQVLDQLHLSHQIRDLDQLFLGLSDLETQFAHRLPVGWRSDFSQ